MQEGDRIEHDRALWRLASPRQEVTWESGVLVGIGDTEIKGLMS